MTYPSTETLSYHAVPELQSLTLAELESLWELVPTQRQKRFRDRLDHEVRRQGAHGSDEAEQQLIAVLLDKYQTEALVPVGARWVKAPRRIQAAARTGEVLNPPEQDLSRQSLSAGPLMLIGGGLLIFVCLFGFLLLRGGGSEANNDLTAVVETTPTLRYTITPSPIALLQSDEVIREGDRDRALSYPIGLQILPDDGQQPRVFIVQRRRVELAEWQYDSNPDTASFLSDLPVRKVIGIPFTPENAALFEELDENGVFVLRLNTGGELRFAFATKETVRRSDTGHFRQFGPGLVLMLIGEKGQDGLPSGERVVVTTTYLAEQELGRGGVLHLDAGLPTAVPTQVPIWTPTPTPDLHQFLHVSLIGPGVETHEATSSIRIHLRLYNSGASPVTLQPEDFQLALGYSENPPGPWLVADSLEPLMLMPQQAVDVTLVWSWHNEPFAALQVVGRLISTTLID
ncbi:MAG: hypothetical protein L0154_26515 [Chloroflexi bacterium]|nr:hypothetical protein [Chloroflexota bacterium]